MSHLSYSRRLKVASLVAVVWSPFLVVAETQSDPFVSDQNTTFLAHFDQQIEADASKGLPDLKAGVGAMTEGASGRFGEALKCGYGESTIGSSALFPVPVYYLSDNIPLSSGTMEFWFRPNFSRSERGSLYYLFDIPTTHTADSGDPIRATLCVTQEPGSAVQYLRLFPGKISGSKELTVPIEWAAKEWHHIAMVWNAETMTLFVDGEMKGTISCQGGLFEGNTVAIENLLGIFVLGGLWESGVETMADGDIDELRISDVPRYHDSFEIAPR